MTKMVTTQMNTMILSHFQIGSEALHKEKTAIGNKILKMIENLDNPEYESIFETLQNFTVPSEYTYYENNELPKQ